MHTCRCRSSSLSRSRSRSLSLSFSLRSLARCSTSLRGPFNHLISLLPQFGAIQRDKEDIAAGTGVPVATVKYLVKPRNRRYSSVGQHYYNHHLIRITVNYFWFTDRGTEQGDIWIISVDTIMYFWLYRADWLAWIGMSTGLGSGEGLLNTKGGLSFSSLSSIGSSLMMTGVGGGPESECPSPQGSEELDAGAETLMLLAELLRGGGPLDIFWGETDCELVLLLLGALLLLLLLAMLLPLFPLEWYVPLNGGWLFKVPWKGVGRHPGEQLDGTPGPVIGMLGAEEEPGGKDEKPPIWLVDGLGKGERGVGGVWDEDW